VSAEIDDDTLSALLCYSTRYAMGRRTYAASQVATAVRQYRGHLTGGDREAILREYDVAARDGHLGDECDAQAWRQMAEALTAPSPEPREEKCQACGDGWRYNDAGARWPCKTCGGTGKGRE
jgi:hypothetical protein